MCQTKKVTEANKTRKNSNGASTMETLIRFGVEELQRSGSIDFNLENVLRESGVARGSLYHHFGSRHGLISHCEAVLLKSSLKTENEFIRTVIDSGKSGEELFELLASFTRINGSEALREQRGRRVRTLAAAVEDEALKKLIAESQMKGSAFLVESFALAKDKGIIDPRVPLDALVYLMQAMFLGRILVDITGDAELSDSVNEATVTTFRYLLNPQS
jgi:AcrR family transcriptional regulator